MTGFFDRRWRGFRVVNLVGWGLLAAMILGVYLAKTMAWGERNQIASVEIQIRQEKLRIRLLEAEVAHLEQPRRLEALSAGALGMAPIGPKQEIALDDLHRFERQKPIPAPTLAEPPVFAQADVGAPGVAAKIAVAGPVTAQFSAPQVTQQ